MTRRRLEVYAPRYPRLLVDVTRIGANAGRMVEACGDAVEIMGVTKGVAGDVAIARAFVDAGVSSLGDARLGNLERLKSARLGVPLWLVRSPGPSEVPAAVELADGSLESERNVVRLLAAESLRQAKRHQVILMVDLDTGREGLAPEDVPAVARDVASSEGLILVGLGVYFDFKSDPSIQSAKLEALCELGARAGVPLRLLSGGSSNVLHGSVLEGRLPSGINHLRVGTAPLLGISTSHGPRVIGGWDRDTFLLEAEVIEVKRDRREAVLALGNLDAPSDYIYPVDFGVVVAGASSDHTIVDFERAERALTAGDVVRFRLGYYAMSRLLISPYVRVDYST